LFKLTFPLLLAALCGQANAAEITLERSAVDKLVAQALFKDHGRLTLARGACGTYLDQPSVSLAGGRVQIRSHLKASVGFPVNGDCAGISLSSWTKVSGRPTSAGGSVRLEDIRIDEVDDPDTRAVLVNSGLASAFPRAFELDVRSAVQNMLSKGGDNPVQATVDAFSFEDVSVVGDTLHLQFDFKLTGR
jgi:hypothetical protein